MSQDEPSPPTEDHEPANDTGQPMADEWPPFGEWLPPADAMAHANEEGYALAYIDGPWMVGYPAWIVDPYHPRWKTEPLPE